MYWYILGIPKNNSFRQSFALIIFSTESFKD